MSIAMGLFHDRKLIDRATAVLKRAGHSFQRIIISAQMGREDELSPDVPLARAVLTAARRVENEVKMHGDAAGANAVGAKASGANAAGSAAGANAAADNSEGSIASQGDFRRLLSERGLAGHQVDGFMKHVLGGHLLAIFTFDQPGAAGSALSVLERMGALRVARVDESAKAEEPSRPNWVAKAVTGSRLEDETAVRGEDAGTPGG